MLSVDPYRPPAGSWQGREEGFCSMNGKPVAIAEKSGEPPAYVFDPICLCSNLYSPEITEKFLHEIAMCAANAAFRKYRETKAWSIRAAKAFT
jgi:hypothetical protein